MRYVVLFAIILGCVQQLQGTDLFFSVLTFLFIVISTSAFNLVGGFTYPSGGYIFFYSFGVIAGITGKAILGEPGQSLLSEPTLTLEVFLGGAVALFFAAFVTKRFRARKPFLQNAVKPEDMRNASYGCIIVGIVLSALLYIPTQSGSLLSALNQLNQFFPMAIILGTIYQIRKSGGANAFNLSIGLAILFPLVDGGILHFSKQGLFAPLLCFIIAASSLRYRMSLAELGTVALFFFLMVYYMVPYSQIGRNREGRGTLSGGIVIAEDMFTHLDDVRQEYQETSQEALQDRVVGYYSTPVGLLDRIQILRPDDDLIHVTKERGPIGLYPIVLYFENLIPHVFYPNKPTLTTGNDYAHEVGTLIAEDDETTGISFSPSGEAYHLGAWFGVLVVMPILLCMLFLLFDSLCGDVRRAPWGLLMLAVFSHSAPEGMLVGIVYMMGFTTMSLLTAVAASAYVMPILGTLIAGPDRSGPRRILARTVPR